MPHFSFLRQLLAATLCLSLAAPAGFGQSTDRTAADTLPLGPNLKIAVLDGAGAANNIRARTAVQPVVEVRDQNDRPVNGARVTFRLPSVGPGASFEGGQLEQQTSTNRLGQAAASGMVPNQHPGRFHIQVEAAFEGLSASAAIPQQNMSGAAAESAKSSHWWIYALAAGAAGGVAGIFATRGNGGSSSTPAAIVGPTLTITPGTPSVSGPR